MIPIKMYKPKGAKSGGIERARPIVTPTGKIVIPPRMNNPILRNMGHA